MTTIRTNFAPALPAQEDLPIRVKVLVDCSGSMSGDSIKAARHALESFLKGLRPTDRFSLSRSRR